MLARRLGSDGDPACLLQDVRQALPHLRIGSNTKVQVGTYETIRSASVESKAFCEAMESLKASDSERYEKFRQLLSSTCRTLPLLLTAKVSTVTSSVLRSCSRKERSCPRSTRSRFRYDFQLEAVNFADLVRGFHLLGLR